MVTKIATSTDKIYRIFFSYITVRSYFIENLILCFLLTFYDRENNVEQSNTVDDLFDYSPLSKSVTLWHNLEINIALIIIFLFRSFGMSFHSKRSKHKYDN